MWLGFLNKNKVNNFDPMECPIVQNASKEINSDYHLLQALKGMLERRQKESSTAIDAIQAMGRVLTKEEFLLVAHRVEGARAAFNEVATVVEGYLQVLGRK